MGKEIISLGILPPQNLDGEETILGAMMLERDSVSLVIDILKPESFYKESHSKIFEAICMLFNQNDPIDLITVINQLRKNGTLEIAGGAYKVTELTSRVNSSANIETHARIIAELYMKREVIKLSTDVTQRTYDESNDIFDILGDLDTKAGEILQNNIKGTFKAFSYAIDETIHKMYNNRSNEFTGVPSGLKKLDVITGGWQNQDLIIIAARPAMGKTAFVVSCAVNAVKAKYATAIFSLEMSTYQLTQRIISSESQIDLQRILKPKTIQDWEWNSISSVQMKMQNCPLYIDDTASLSIIELRAKAKRLKKKHDIKLIVVDYLQLMSGNQKGNREQEISNISRGLKAIAKELDVPVIALSQLSRAVETRGGDKRPQLSDLRESGSIEQDADMVMFLYRPEYYGILEDETGMPLHGKGEVIISKHRNGSIDSEFFKFIGRYTKWTDDEDLGIMFDQNKLPESDSYIAFENETKETPF